MPKARDLNQRNGSDHIRRATSIFTDREDLREAYHNLLHRALEEDFSEYYAILYYGIGGVGKSTLLKKLMEEVCEKKDYRAHRPVILHVDFDSPGMDDSILALVHMKKQFCRQVPRAYFPLFDTALFLLRQRTGEEFETEQQIKDISDNPVLAFGVELLDAALGTVVIDAARRAVLKLGKETREWLVRSKAGLKTSLQEMKALDENALIRNLADYFAADVNRVIADDPNRVICVFLDTYERLASFVHPENKLNRTYQRDEWIHGGDGLMRLMGNTIFAIAGRHRPAWADEDSLWAESRNLEKHLTKGLSEENTRDFLKSNQIVDYDIQSAIYNLTSGEPVYLDLCVRQYRNLLMSGIPRTTDFGSSINELIDRHLRYIKDEMRDELCLMAAMRRWTDDLYDGVTQSVGMNAVRSNSSSYEQLMRLSYIDVNGSKDGIHTMHSVVADLLAMRLPEKIRLKAFDVLIELWKKQQCANNSHSDIVLEAALSIAGWRDLHSQQFGPEHVISSEADEELALALLQRAEQEPHVLRKIPWHEYSYTILRHCFGIDDNRTVTGLIRLSSDYFRAGRYIEADSILKNELSRLQDSIGECAQPSIDVMVALAETKKQLYDIDTCRALLRKAYELQKQILGEMHPITLDLMLQYEKQQLYDDVEFLHSMYHCYEVFSAYYGRTHEKVRSIMQEIFSRLSILANPMNPDNVDSWGNMQNATYARAAAELAATYAVELAETGLEREALQVRRFAARMTAYAGQREEAFTLLQNDSSKVIQLFGQQHEEVLWHLIYQADMCPSEQIATFKTAITDFLNRHPNATLLLHQMCVNHVEDMHAWALFRLIDLQMEIEAACKQDQYDHLWLLIKKNALQMTIEEMSADTAASKRTVALQLLEAMQQLIQGQCTEAAGFESILSACMQYADNTEENASALDEKVVGILFPLVEYLHRSRFTRSSLTEEECIALQAKAVLTIQSMIRMCAASKGEQSFSVYELKRSLIELCDQVGLYDAAASTAEEVLVRQTVAFGKSHSETARALHEYVMYRQQAGITVDKKHVSDWLREIIRNADTRDSWMTLMDSKSICQLLDLPLIWIELCDIYFQRAILTEPECMTVDRTFPEYPFAICAKNDAGRALKQLVDSLEGYMLDIDIDRASQLEADEVSRLKEILNRLHNVYEKYQDIGGMLDCETWIDRLPL